MNIKQILNGETGAEASETLFKNDIEASGTHPWAPGKYYRGQRAERGGVIYTLNATETEEEPSLTSLLWQPETTVATLKANAFNNAGYVEKGNGSIITDVNDLKSSSFLRLTGGPLVVTGYSGRDDAAALVAFYDKDRKFLGAYNTNTQGWVSKVTVPPASIPAGSVYIKSTRHQAQEPYIEGADFLFRPSIFQEYVDLAAATLRADLASLSTRNEKDFFNVPGYVEKGNGSIIPDGDLRASVFLKLDKTKDTALAGYSGANDAAALVAFYDKDYKFISAYNPPTPGANQYVVPKANCPADAVYARFTRTAAQPVQISGPLRYMADLDIQAMVSSMVGALRYVDSEAGYFSITGYVNKRKGWVDPQTDFVSTRFIRLNKAADTVVSGYSGRDDSAALLAYYDKDFKFISAYNTATQGIVENVTVPKASYPATAVYIRATSTAAHLNRKVAGHSIAARFNDSVAYSDALNARITDVLLEANLPFNDTVRIKNYLNNYQNIHPKVLYFPAGLWGFRYWMGYTPFPNEFDQYENPCIAVSNDGKTWEVPPGHINPLAYAPANGYNSDTHLVYREDTKTLECWYRPYNNATTSAKLVRRTTQDGSTWTPAEEIPGIDGVLSPSIIFEGGKYKLWYPDSSQTIYYTESAGASPQGWSAPIGKLINVMAWHMDVIKTGNVIEYLIQGWRPGKGDNFSSSMFYMKDDGGPQQDAVEILNIYNLPGNPSDYLGLYRGCILKVGAEYRVFYSYIRRDRYQGMVMARGGDIYRLLPHLRDLSTEASVHIQEDDETRDDMYIHSAASILVRDCSLVVRSFTGMRPGQVIEIAVTGSNGSCELVAGPRLIGSANITEGSVKVVALDSRTAQVL